MDVDAFWELVERSDRESGTRRERLAWLENELSRLPAEEIVDFKMWWCSVTGRLCTWDMYAVYCCTVGWGSLNGFEYFVSWLVSLGREPFERVAECADEAIELPQLLRLLEILRARIANGESPSWSEEEEPNFELLGHVTLGPYRRVTGLDTGSPGDAVRARGVHPRFPLIELRLGGEEWDFGDHTEMVRRLPRLARHRGISQ
ncbi:DUF4240 domain-containing protein [Streptosporangium sp. NPDC051022]|uniref:DUF4240 domain-containing protein n=1 Tax=Streptosporangium sp. NPDC051022 TaxID=3155752 RepID=UPI0034209860